MSEGRRALSRVRGAGVALAAMAALAAIAVIAAACSGGDDDSPPPSLALPDGGTVFAADYPHYVDPTSGIKTILGTPDLGVGRHRVGFVLSDADGLVRLPVVSVQSFFLPSGVGDVREGPVENGVARFFEFPYGVRGMHSLELSFDRPGMWEVEVRLPRPDGSTARSAFAFAVAERTLAPAVGEPAPPSQNRAAGDVESLRELTTGAEPDPALYRLSVAEALQQDRPLVVVFASPAFCTNALCGPQVEVLGELAAQYGERASFVHVDLYENPHEIRGDLDRAIRTPILEQWGVETDEWTFVVDVDGLVYARFEAFVTRDELEQSLLRVLDDAAAGSAAGGVGY